MHNDHLTEFSNLVFLSMGCYCLACKPCTRRTTWLSGHFREDLYGLGHVTGWELYDLHDLVHVSRVGYIDISSVGYINISTIPRESRKSTPEMCFFFHFLLVLPPDWHRFNHDLGRTKFPLGRSLRYRVSLPSPDLFPLARGLEITRHRRARRSRTELVLVDLAEAFRFC